MLTRQIQIGRWIEKSEWKWRKILFQKVDENNVCADDKKKRERMETNILTAI